MFNLRRKHQYDVPLWWLLGHGNKCKGFVFVFQNFFAFSVHLTSCMLKICHLIFQPLVESTKILADTIGKTTVYFSYQNSGCTWVGSLADSLFHCSDCVFGNSHVMCSWCGIHIAHRQWREHVQVCHVSLLPLFMSKYINACLLITRVGPPVGRDILYLWSRLLFFIWFVL